jgi:hypothetical protein
VRRRRNVTITLDDELARWARVKAAEQDTSVSKLVGDLLRNLMRQHERFGRARREFESLTTAIISSGPCPRREDLHERPGVR